MKFICYNFLPVLADYIIDLPIERYSGYGITPLHNYTQLDLNKLKDGEKIFVKTDLLNQFFIFIYPKIKNKFILITGVSDYEIDDKYLIYLNDERLIKWIGVNISIQNHPKIYKFFIGFSEPDRRKNGTANGIYGDQDILFENYKNRKDFNNKLNRIFISHFSNTHPARKNINKVLNNLQIADIGEKMEFEDYLQKINDYKFILCPRGNGLDTHRFCESLLLGSIPIVEKNGISDLLEKFPCIIVNNFNDITIDLIKDYKFDQDKYNLFETYLFIEKLDLKFLKD
jgi:hypothetical protein